MSKELSQYSTMSAQRPPKPESGDELSGELADCFGPPREVEAADWPCEPSRERMLYQERVSAGQDAPTIYAAAEVLVLLRANLGNRGVSHPMHVTDLNDPFDIGLAAVCEFFDNDLSNLWISRRRVDRGEQPRDGLASQRPVRRRCGLGKS
jgi:hypothetical protein